MTLPRYPEYKASGVGWMEAVPSHWKLLQLGQAATERCDGPFGSGLTSEHYTDDGALVVRLQNIKAGSFHSGEPAYIGLDYFRQDLTRHAVQADDLLIAGLGDERNVVGRACVAPAGLGEALVKADCFRFRLNPQLAIPQFTALQLSAGASFDAGALAGGTTRSRIPLGAMASRKLALPPLDEQVGITAFLDHETAKIDALIAEQEKLIALLAEKRQATIFHAVTRGLNPRVPMKDSGVPWLGEVPAHWRVGKAGFYVTVLPGYAFPSNDFSLDDSEVRLLRGINVSVGELRWDEVVYWRRAIDDGLDAFELKVGDVVIGMDRPLIGAGMRVATVVESDLPCLLLQRVAKIQPGQEIDGRFIMRLLASRAFEAHFAPETTGVSVPHISGEQISNFVIPVAPLDEQHQICDFLDEELDRLQRLQLDACRAIDLLRERRSALIAAAVTGQIDVRGFTAA